MAQPRLPVRMSGAAQANGVPNAQEGDMQQVLSNLWLDDSAQDTSEYALLLLLLTAALAATVTLLGDRILAIFKQVLAALGG